jgi:hypothetical protein
MGSMAGKTPVTAFHGTVRGHDLGRFLAMTIKTERIASLHKEGLVLGGVGIVTGQAHSLLEGNVHHITARLQVRWVVALIAEVTPIFGGLKGILRPG